jgi:hypothetical protein
MTKQGTSDKKTISLRALLAGGALCVFAGASIGGAIEH